MACTPLTCFTAAVIVPATPATENDNMFKKRKGKQETDAVAERLRKLEKEQWLVLRRLEDIHALGVLQPLLINRPMLPISGSSLRPHCILHIINDLIVNSRRHVIEFGSGISTLILARLMKLNGLDASIVAVDHDERWASLLTDQLRQEGLEGVAETIVAPLSRDGEHSTDGEWYDLDVLRSAISDRRFDLVLVDGPPAWEPSKSRARQPALPFILGHLLPSASIYLDDANRTGERAVIGQWTHHFNIPFNMTGGTLAYAYLGNAFYTEPLTSLKHGG